MFVLAPNIVCHTVRASFHPSFDISTQVGPKEPRSDSEKSFILAHVGTRWSRMKMREDFATQGRRYNDEAYIFFLREDNFQKY